MPYAEDWLPSGFFPQEKATFHRSPKVSVISQADSNFVSGAVNGSPPGRYQKPGSHGL
jgi:hypothetical protein